MKGNRCESDNVRYGSFCELEEFCMCVRKILLFKKSIILPFFSAQRGLLKTLEKMQIKTEFVATW